MKSVKLLVSSLLLALVLVGCTTTIIPTEIVADGASFSESGKRDSGLYGFYTNNTGVVFAVISEHNRDRYNSFIDIYGKKIPTIKRDYGIQDNGTNCYMTLEALSYYGKMSRWFKADFK